MAEETLSIDHVIPWLHSDNPIELFFDLKNIKFSHKKCNGINRRNRFSVHGKSGYKGVQYREANKKKKWQAYSYCNNKTKFIGSYETEVEAAEAYDNAMIEKHGEAAVTNKFLGLI
jgi:hypothetical protein